MIRRDYILRMLEEFFELLSRIRALKQGQHWREAAGAVEEGINKLLGQDARAICQLSRTELLARLIQGEPTQVVRQKTRLLTALLKDAGDVAAAENRLEDSRAFHLKGLELLLDTLATGEPEDFPEFVPTVEAFVAALSGSVLPAGTQVRLMQHYERTGEFGKAEDTLFALVDAEPARDGLLEFGLAFYDRLRTHTDASLSGGNLPRTELEAGRAELSRRLAD